MAELQIKTVSLPLRCDICHQRDKFNAENNYCSRCIKVKNKLKIKNIIKDSLQGYINWAGELQDFIITFLKVIGFGIGFFVLIFLLIIGLLRSLHKIH